MTNPPLDFPGTTKTVNTHWLWEGNILRAAQSSIEGILPFWRPGFHITTQPAFDGDRISPSSDSIVARLATITQAQARTSVDPALDYLNKLGLFMTRLVNSEPGELSRRMFELLGEEGMAKVVDLAQLIETSVAGAEEQDAQVIVFPRVATAPEPVAVECDDEPLEMATLFPFELPPRS